MLKPENQPDQKRFQKLKGAEKERGRDDRRATKTAAHEVKELRKREGRSKSE